MTPKVCLLPAVISVLSGSVAVRGFHKDACGAMRNLIKDIAPAVLERAMFVDGKDRKLLTDASVRKQGEFEDGYG